MRTRLLLAALTLAGPGMVGPGMVGPSVPSVAATSGHDVHKVIDRNFPDPGVLQDGGRSYLYATGAGFRVLSSDSPESGYVDHGASMPPEGRPAWFGRGLHGDLRLWAPHVVRMPALLGRPTYLMYFSASRRGGYDCIGVARAGSPLGPFLSAGPPLVCGGRGGTVIDPAVHRSLLGDRFLVFKHRRLSPDLNQIRGIRLAADGASVVSGARSFSLVRTGASVVEAPSVVTSGGRVWLFVSRRNFANCTYYTQVWSARVITGPFEPAGPDAGRLPIRGPNGSAFCGPGGAEVVRDGNGHRIFFHVWRHHDWWSADRARVVWTGRIAWTDAAPRLVRR